MDATVYEQVDRYLNELFVCSDEALESALCLAKEEALPPIQVSPSQGKLLNLLTRIVGARRVLEIGTLGAYSTIWLARALPEDGQVVTLESDPHHAEVARRNIEMAGLGDRVDVVDGLALETLPRLEQTRNAPFDLVFVDADKENYPAYLEWCVRLARPGALIVADNIVRGGAVLDPDPLDTAAVGARDFNAALAAHPQLDAVVLQLVGAKGHDGLAIAIMK